jgi:hypothetical protein
LIRSFTRDAHTLKQLVIRHRFAKAVVAFDPSAPRGPENTVTRYAFQGDTIEYYPSPTGAKLLYCSLRHAARYAKEVTLFNTRKGELLPAKYQTHQRVLVVDEAGFEDLELTFSKNKVVGLRYRAHPD